MEIVVHCPSATSRVLALEVSREVADTLHCQTTAKAPVRGGSEWIEHVVVVATLAPLWQMLVEQFGADAYRSLQRGVRSLMRLEQNPGRRRVIFRDAPPGGFGYSLDEETCKDDKAMAALLDHDPSPYVAGTTFAWSSSTAQWAPE